MKRFLILMTAAVFVFILTACGGGNALDPEADDPNLSDEEWAREVWDEAIDNMVSDGDIVLSETEEQIFDSDLEDQIAFTSDAAKEKYTNSEFQIDDKVIWAEFHADDPQLDDYFSVDTKPESADKNVPTYASVRATGDVPDDIFADKRGQCRYLIVTAGLISSYYPEYYAGGKPRVGISTEVFVIDAPERKVVHIEHVGYDIPGVVTSNNIGDIDFEAAWQYMSGICK